MTSYFVRVGVLGRVQRMASADGGHHPHGRRVICRTQRGLEVGEILSRTNGLQGPDDGSVLRRVTPEDDLLIARQEKNKEAAVAECEALLTDRNISATLMDVELLFDGKSLVFYFVGAVTPEIEAMTRELAEAYESRVQFRQFTDALERGCGPDCGTESSTGCGSSCQSCTIATACGAKR